MNQILEYLNIHKKTIILTLLILCSCYFIYSTFINQNKNIQKFSNSKKKIIKKYKETVLSESPKIVYIENFVTKEEAEHLMKVADQIKRPSTIDTKEDPYTLVNNVRSSESAHLGKSRDAITISVENKACEYVNLDTSHLEPMQVVVYEKGQKYNPHYDFFNSDSVVIEKYGNRTKTILVYLNDLSEEAGGNTYFPKLDLRIKNCQR